MKRTTRVRKNKGQRGNTSHGWGGMKKRRGAGNRGGRGMAGTGKRADQKKPTIINLYRNTYFGRRGFTVPNPKAEWGINIRDLNIMLANGSITTEVNLTKLGYTKLLAMGKLNKPLAITVAAASARAIEKVKNAGGNVILPTQEAAE
jgi:large subunit ribosomal protein L15